MNSAITVLVAAALLPATSVAQTTPAGAAPAHTFRLQSRQLREERVIDVSLPRGYEAGTERYPVIVVLDGEFAHEIAAAAAKFYASSAMMPRTIVVGVRNTSRSRDFTPAGVGGFQPPPEMSESGGADRFVAFFADELLPELDRRYRTAPFRVLVGHSLGGLLALHALATHPGLFNGHVIMEPAIWWNGEHEWRAAMDALRGPAARRTRVMFVNTPIPTVDTTRWGGDAAMVRHIEIEGETHESMAAAGMLRAMRTLFEDFRPPAWRPGTRPIAMLLRYDSLAGRVGYAVPIPPAAYERAIRMSIHARHFDDAERMLVLLERALGSTAGSDLRTLLEEERVKPVPEGFIPLEIPARRPSPAEASRFVGRWQKIGGGRPHEITVRAAGDTIVVHSRIQLPDGSWDAGDRPVIQVTPEGTLEWGLPWFRGIAALVVLKGELLADGSMRVTREPRGWVPRGPAGELRGVETFRRTDH